MKKQQMKRLMAQFLVIVMLLSLLPMQVFAANSGVAVASAGEKPLKLWYDEPATDWQTQALPIGNGHMGAMIFGGTDTERIQMNEETLWTNGPGGNSEQVVAGRDSLSDVFGNVDAYGSGAMGKYIEKCFADYYNHAYSSSPAQSGELKILPNHRLGLGTFTNFAELYLDLNHSGVSNYHRELDLRAGLSAVTHTANGVNYTRKTFMSHPDNVMVYQITADQTGSVNMTVRPEIAFNGTSGESYNDRGNDGRQGTVIADLDSKTIHLDGKLDNDMKFAGDFYVLPQGGTMTASNPETGIPQSKGSFTITGADSVIIIVALATNYANVFPNYRQEDPDYARKDVEARIAAVKGRTFDTLYQKHYADHNELFSRVELDLGGVYDEAVTTDVLLSTWRSASASGTQNHYLEELYFQYGRYLLMASSREDSLPANLQGIWADQKRPPWQSDYHTNINLQMNYWPAYTTNLAETGESLVNYVDSLQAPGALTAKKLYGTENTWMVNCSASAMGFTGNINSAASLASTANAFILQNVYDHYQFTQDREILKSQIYPMMKSACNLFIQIMKPGRTELDQDRLFMVPSYSSEQGSTYTIGATYDQQLIYLLFSDTVDAAHELGVDAEFAATLEDMMERIHPVEIGLDGQIKEYQQEGKYLTDIFSGNQIPGTEKSHRHNSQLIALHPGNIISTETPELMKAAERSLNLRGDGASGWSMGQKLNMWARLGDGNRAYNKLFTNLIKNGTYNNLFDKCPPFQIDGNFGGCAGVAEMLLQSYAGYVDILPALPDAWATGSFSGLVAEGNFEVAANWTNKQVTTLEITSRSGSRLNVKASAVTKVVDKTTGVEITNITYNEDGSFGFATQQGHTYAFTVADSADFSKVQGAVDAYQDFSTYAYTDGTEFDSLLTTAERVAEQKNCYVPALDDLTSQLDAAFAELTARDADAYAAVLALRLKDSVEENGIAPDKNGNHNAYRVYGTPVIDATHALLDSGDASACWLQGLELVQTLQKYGKIAERTDLYTLLANTNDAARGNETLAAVQKQAEAVFLNVSATAEEIEAATQMLREAAQGKADIWHVTITAGVGGSIAPELDTEVANGGSLTVTLTPDDGYAVLDLLVNGQSVGAVSTYTLNNIHEDMTVTARFQRAGLDEVCELLNTAIALAESLMEEKYDADSWAAMQEKLIAAKAEGASDAEANALLAAIDALVPVSSHLAWVEAESQGLNVAWDDGWTSTDSGMPDVDRVAEKIAAFREEGKTIILGYGEKGKTPSLSGKDPVWKIQTDNRMYGGKQLDTRAADPWLQFTFTGDRVQYYAEKAATGCMADVYIDGVKITTLDMSDAGGVQKFLGFDSANYEASKNLENGEHTLMIHAIGVGKVSAFLAPYQILRADAFDVYGVSPMTSKSALAASIAKARSIDRTQYSADSLSVLDEKLANAEATLLNEAATQEDVNLAKGTLDDALNALGKATKTLTGVTNPVGLTVEIGTTADALRLPETVAVTVKEKDGEATNDVMLQVEWQTSGYDSMQLGVQNICGRIVLPESGIYENPDEIKAEIAVTVKMSTAQSYTLKASAGAGGSILPRGIYELALGEKKTFTITPNEGYEIFNVTLNGKSLGAVAQYTVANLTEDAELVAMFKEISSEQTGSTLLDQAIALAESLTEEKYDANSWAAMQEKLAVAKSEGASDAEANALLAAIDALVPVSTLTGRIEAEGEGVNEAWNSNWESTKSGMPTEPDVKALIDTFLDNGKTIIVGYGEQGKVTTRKGSKPEWGRDAKTAAGGMPPASGGYEMVSRAKDPWLQFTFTGDRVVFFTEKANTACVADIYIDGELIAEKVDLSSKADPSETQVPVFDTKDFDKTANLSNGKHTFMIHAVGVGVVSASGSPYQILRVDAFDVYGSTPAVEKKELAETIAEAEKIDLNGCTAASAEELRLALETAKTVLLNERADQNTMNEALGNLKLAMNALVYEKQEITEVVPSMDVTVPVGTAFESIPLPQTVAFYTDHGYYRANATWDEAEYDLQREGRQTIHGTLALDEEHFINPNGLKAEVVICTSTNMQGIRLDRAELSLEVGKTATLRATYIPENIQDRQVYWYSTDPSVATVDANGNVTAESVGTTTVIAASANGEYTAYCVVTVEKANPTKPVTPPIIRPPFIPTMPGLPFTDVSGSDWFYDAVDYVYDNGLMDGVGGGKFNPNAGTTRGMIVTILYRQAGSPKVYSDGAKWWSDARVWAMENGISDGTNMDGAITREQLAAMLYRYAKQIGADTSKSTSLNKFNDAARVSSYAVAPMQWAVANGIISGRGNNMLAPKAGATRAETAAMLMRFIENVIK